MITYEELFELQKKRSYGELKTLEEFYNNAFPAVLDLLKKYDADLLRSPEPTCQGWMGRIRLIWRGYNGCVEYNLTFQRTKTGHEIIYEIAPDIHEEKTIYVQVSKEEFNESLYGKYGRKKAEAA